MRLIGVSNECNISATWWDVHADEAIMRKQVTVERVPSEFSMDCFDL
jgi:hypothetical protein